MVISEEELRIEPKKMKAVRDWLILKIIKKVQAFLKFANYYQWFIYNYSQYIIPLTKLIKKNQVFK